MPADHRNQSIQLNFSEASTSGLGAFFHAVAVPENTVAYAIARYSQITTVY